MATVSRRHLLATFAGSISYTALRSACGQFSSGGLTQAQRNEYARVFQAIGASDRELSILSDIQNNRVALPSGAKNFRDFIEESPAMVAMAAGATPELGMLKLWHDLALDATALDHTTLTQPAPPEYGEHFGPTRSRALAIVHIAMFEAVNTVHKQYNSYKDLRSTILENIGVPDNDITPSSASVSRAIVEAAYSSLVWLYGNKRVMFEQARTLSLPRIGDAQPAQELGAAIGEAAAEATRMLRQDDKSDMPDLSSDDFGTSNPLDWRTDPISNLGPALGGNWWRVSPFVISSSDQYRPEPPPTAGDTKFIEAYKDVRTLGGDPEAPTELPRWKTPTTRKGHQTTPPFDDNNESFRGVFWAYDGTPGMCAPPRLYNMVATSIAMKERPVTTVSEFSRMLALINIAMADACIAAWEAKYHYAYARPVTVIRSMAADDTAEGNRDPKWTPLGAPVTNGRIGERNLTPPFPAYPSGHATFGGALFETSRIVLKEPGDPEPFDGIPFDFVSDEYNGHNRQPGDAQPRPLSHGILTRSLRRKRRTDEAEFGWVFTGSSMRPAGSNKGEASLRRFAPTSLRRRESLSGPRCMDHDNEAHSLAPWICRAGSSCGFPAVEGARTLRPYGAGALRCRLATPS